MMATFPPVDIYFEHVMSRQNHDTSARLKDIRPPTLVMVGGDETHGTSDTTHVESSEILARAIPNATFTILEGEGHFYTHSKPELTNGIIRRFAAGEPIPRSSRRDPG